MLNQVCMKFLVLSVLRRFDFLRMSLPTLFGCLILMIVALPLVGCADLVASPNLKDATHSEINPVEENYGIRVEGLRLSAAGSMLDFRYRVLNAEKATPFLDGKNQPLLLDELRGAKLNVPNTPKLGRIRQTARNGKIVLDRTYFIMFGNPGKALQSGDKVQLLIGQLRVAELTVQ